jgi:hypothetical protein
MPVRGTCVDDFRDLLEAAAIGTLPPAVVTIRITGGATGTPYDTNLFVLDTASLARRQTIEPYLRDACIRWLNDVCDGLRLHAGATLACEERHEIQGRLL